MNWVDAFELVLGSAVLVGGLGISALAAVQETFPGVFVGFVLFVAGYKLSQVAVRESEETGLQQTVADMLAGAEGIDLLMVLVGTGMIAYGFTLLFNGFQRTDLAGTAVASGLLFLGYATAHYGVNDTLV